MLKKSIFTHVFVAQLIVIVLATAMAFALFAKITKASYVESAEDKLETLALSLKSLLMNEFQTDQISSAKSVEAKLKSISSETNVRITLIRRDGLVVFESTRDPQGMENHANRPEFLDAIQSGRGRAVRYSATLEKMTIYYAVAVANSVGETKWVLRTAMTVRSLEHDLKKHYSHLLLTTLVSSIVAVCAAYFLSWKLALPLERIKNSAASVANGNLHPCPSDFNIKEIDDLAVSISTMSEILRTRISEERKRKNELALVLECMSEGVLAMDMNDNVFAINKAAVRILDLTLPGGVNSVGEMALSGKGLLRFNELHDFLDELKRCGDITCKRVEVVTDVPKILDLQGGLMRSDDGGSLGVLMTITDVTEVAGIDKVRREFAANVTHELKTPLTAIRGAVETLLDGAMDDKGAVRRFLEIIRKHSVRLTALINDVMVLSKVERQAETGELLNKKSFVVRDMLASVLELCGEKIESRRIDVVVKCAPDLTLVSDEDMLCQALVNLLDNALKFSPTGGEVVLEATASSNGFVSFSVADHGVGIHKEHFSRLFERFYRVDKGRGRKDGGTGLGLAIVKHIANVLGGSVSVNSIPNVSTVFTVRVPDCGEEIE